ncbi:hypothetical protein BGS_0661 [Beggiatoa sp. SS]|nr:hypothetical protein BGS_0661 [Beggiatoa sp. SS]
MIIEKMLNETPEQRAEKIINAHFGNRLTAEEHALVVQIWKAIYLSPEAKAISFETWHETVTPIWIKTYIPSLSQTQYTRKTGPPCALPFLLLPQNSSRNRAVIQFWNPLTTLDFHFLSRLPTLIKVFLKDVAKRDGVVRLTRGFFPDLPLPGDAGDGTLTKPR